MVWFGDVFPLRLPGTSDRFGARRCETGVSQECGDSFSSLPSPDSCHQHFWFSGVPCGPVYTYAQMFADPQVQHRGLVQYASDAELGEVPHIRTPIRIGEGVRLRSVAPKLGQHNAEIFGRLGVTDARIKELRAKGVL